jgi:hypothetical protein
MGFEWTGGGALIGPWTEALNETNGGGGALNETERVGDRQTACARFIREQFAPHRAPRPPRAAVSSGPGLGV